MGTITHLQAHVGVGGRQRHSDTEQLLARTSELWIFASIKKLKHDFKQTSFAAV
jgi:hypothetical protein